MRRQWNSAWAVTALTALLWCSLTAGAVAANAPSVTAGGPYEGAVNVPLRVEATTTIGAISGVYWQFSDGSSDRGLIASKTFEAPGVYEVSVTVTDERGKKATARTTATIRAPAP